MFLKSVKKDILRRHEGAIKTPKGKKGNESNAIVMNSKFITIIRDK
jgi:hypothetical protein